MACRKHGEAFLGYLQAQRLKLEQNRSGRPTRPELLERYGFDTKYAMHVLRLGYQGVEYLTTGRISLPLPEPTRSHLWALRMGEVPLPDAMEEAQELEREIQRLTNGASPLREEPDHDSVNSFLRDAYLSHWSRASSR